MKQARLRIDGVEQGPRLTQVVVGQLTDLITTGALRRGDSLPSEAALASSFKVSKAVVREALRQLAILGVVEARKGKPTTVKELTSEPLELFFRFATSIDATGLRDAIELRRALESQAVMLAAVRADDGDLATLERLLSIMSANRLDDFIWIPTHVEFHLALVHATKNRCMAYLLEALRGTIEHSNRLVRSGALTRNFDETFQRHAAIFDAVRRHDPGQAQSAMARHFDAVDEVVARLLPWRE